MIKTGHDSSNEGEISWESDDVLGEEAHVDSLVRRFERIWASHPHLGPSVSALSSMTELHATYRVSHPSHMAIEVSAKW